MPINIFLQGINYCKYTFFLDTIINDDMQYNINILLPFIDFLAIKKSNYRVEIIRGADFFKKVRERFVDINILKRRRDHEKKS